MGKTKCPKCHRSFDDDFDRYVIGSVANTLKFSINAALQLGGGALGAPFGTMTSRAGGEAGKKIAESIGCGEKDFTGWHHRCPYCGHTWEK